MTLTEEEKNKTFDEMTPFEKDRWIIYRWIGLQNSAEARGIEFGLTYSDVKKLLSAKRCFFTGVPFEKTGPNKHSVDRLDNDLGYVTGNVVACGVAINKAKTNLTVAMIESIYKGLKKKKLVK